MTLTFTLVKVPYFLESRMDNQVAVVVPTAGNVVDEQGKLIPGPNGQTRIKTAHHLGQSLVRESFRPWLVFLGGKRADPKKSEAYVANIWYRQQFAGPFLTMVMDFDIHTAGDFAALGRLSPTLDFAGYIAVCHVDQFDVAAASFGAACPDDAAIHHGFNISCPLAGLSQYDSGEGRPYSKPVKFALEVMSEIDPTWSRWFSAPLRWQARRRIPAHERAASISPQPIFADLDDTGGP